MDFYCVFCDPKALPAGREVVSAPSGRRVMIFEPLNPVTPGHLLVAPVRHVPSAIAEPNVTADAMDVAATYARRYAASNIITSIGADATQTVPHLHLHIVPRRQGDGLALPWDGASDLAAIRAEAWDLRGGALWFDREQWGIVIDALIAHRASADRRKAVNSESTSDVRVGMCADIIKAINAASLATEAGERR